jgi:hypothetical protein
MAAGHPLRHHKGYRVADDGMPVEPVNAKTINKVDIAWNEEGTDTSQTRFLSLDNRLTMGAA